MKIRFTSLFGLLLGIAAPAAFAQPLLSVNMTELDLNGVPSWGANPTAIIPTNSGFPVNGGNGLFTDRVTMWALATGTFPVGGFTYTFFVNGQSIGVAVNVPSSNNDPIPQAVAWTSPQPGVYYFSCLASDGLGHSALSLPVEYFATGISIVSPVNNVIMPVGSSVVIQAAAAISDGAISKVEFFADGVALGTSTNYPYSIIYTPAGPATTVHSIKAQSFLADGATVAATSATQTIVMVAPVGPVPTCVISTPSGTPAAPSTRPIPDYVANPAAFIPIIVNAGSLTGTITEVQLYINGVLFGTDAAFPYTFNWQPTVTGTYNFTALAYDAKNNVIASTTGAAASTTPAPTTVIVGSLPSVAITFPADGATISGGGSGTATVTASATDTNVDSLGNPVPITQVQFFMDGNSIGAATSPTLPGGNLYSVTFVPKQNIDPVSLKVIPSVITAAASDQLGFSATSIGITVSVNLGGSSGGGGVIGTPPTISLTAPANAANVVVNSPVTLSANAQATNNPGNVASVVFLVDNKSIATATTYPYSVTWTPTNLGTYSISAQVTDNAGNVTISPSINVTAVTEPPPTVSITSPTSGGLFTVGTVVTLNATALSPQSGTISQVQFYANGISIGTSTTPPYTLTWTPLATGIYTITAVATDNAGETTTSSSNAVEVAPVNSGVGTLTYFGNYQALTDGGIFAFVTPDGVTGTYIGISTTAGSKNPLTFYTDLAVSSQGSFSSSAINGTASTTGVSGSLSPSGAIFIGGVPLASTYAIASGYYAGDLAGQPNSQVTAVVGSDGEIMVYVTNGSFADAGYGTFGAVGASGAFSITTVGNNILSGTINPSTGFMTGTLSGASGGSILAARVSGGTFSDGVLKNISTRGDVGTGADIMIAGFVVGGTSPKQLLIRAIGPALTGFGVQGAIAATQLQVNSGATIVAANTGWSSTTANASQVSAAEAAAGTFPLTSGSADSALVGSYAPGAYTAMVSGVGSDTGIALVEVYDLDTFTPFTANKLTNVSTRGFVGTGTEVLIGGFIINGSAPKRVLIRAAGPGLGAMGVSGFLAAPRLQLFNSSEKVIRENFSWQTGNDPGVVSAAEAATGAFAFANASADSAILIVLPPGTYTAQVSGAGSATGVALIEVYEVP